MPSALHSSQLEGALDMRSYADWTAALATSLIDSSITETGSNAYFRTSLLLSCVVSQSRQSKHNLHMLVAGDVLQDTARLMDVCSQLVAPHMRCVSVQQMLPMGLTLTQRGVCQVSDLSGATASHPSAVKKLLEFLK